MWCMYLWSLLSSQNQLVWNNVRDIVASIVICGSHLLLDWVTARGNSLGAGNANSANLVSGTQVH